MMDQEYGPNRPDEPYISELFQKYGTDKGVNGYGPIYHALFFPHRKAVKTLLEIGIGSMAYMTGYALPHYKPGGSLRAWRDYFPNALVTGLDIAAETMFEEERIETRFCDTTSLKSVLDAVGEKRYEIIIDDGSHLPAHQLATLVNLYPHLEADGIYVIEDIAAGSPLASEPSAIRNIVGHREFFFTGIGGHCCVILG